MTKETTPEQSGDLSTNLDGIIEEAIGLDDEAIADDVQREETPQPEDEDGSTDDAQEDADDTDDDDSEATEEDGDDSGADDDAKPKKQSRFDKRIGKLTRDKNDAEREANYWKQEAERIAAENAAIAKLTPKATPEQIQAGQQQGFSPEQVQQMVNDGVATQVKQERFTSTVQDLRTKLSDGGATDALARLSNKALTPFEQEAVQALAEAKFPVKVANAIANNDDLFEQFSKAGNATQRARLIDRIDGRLEASANKPKVPTVKPTPKLRGTARPPAKNPDDMSQAEYEVYARKQGWLG